MTTFVDRNSDAFRLRILEIALAKVSPDDKEHVESYLTKEICKCISEVEVPPVDKQSTFAVLLKTGNVGGDDQPLHILLTEKGIIPPTMQPSCATIVTNFQNAKQQNVNVKDRMIYIASTKSLVGSWGGYRFSLSGFKDMAEINDNRYLRIDNQIKQHRHIEVEKWHAALEGIVMTSVNQLPVLTAFAISKDDAMFLKKCICGSRALWSRLYALYTVEFCTMFGYSPGQKDILVFGGTMHSQIGFLVRVLMMQDIEMFKESKDYLLKFRSKLFNSQMKRRRWQITRCSSIIRKFFQYFKEHDHGKMVKQFARCAEDNFLINTHKVDFFNLVPQEKIIHMFSTWSDVTIMGDNVIIAPCRFCKVHFLEDLCTICGIPCNIVRVLCYKNQIMIQYNKMGEKNVLCDVSDLIVTVDDVEGLYV